MDKTTGALAPLQIQLRRLLLAETGTDVVHSLLRYGAIFQFKSEMIELGASGTWNNGRSIAIDDVDSEQSIAAFSSARV